LYLNVNFVFWLANTMTALRLAAGQGGWGVETSAEVEFWGRLSVTIVTASSRK